MVPDPHQPCRGGLPTPSGLVELLRALADRYARCGQLQRSRPPQSTLQP